MFARSYLLPQSLFDPLPHGLDRNVHTRSVAATAAVTIHPAIQIEAFDDDVVLREGPVAARFGRAEDCDDRRASRRGDVHGPRVSADEEFRATRQGEKLFESRIEHDRRVRARVIDHRLRQILFSGAISHDRTYRVRLPQTIRDCAEALRAPELGRPASTGVEDREAAVESLSLS